MLQNLCNIFLVNAYANWLPGSMVTWFQAASTLRPGANIESLSNLILRPSIHRFQARLTKSSDNATVVWRFSKRRSWHALKSNQLQNNLSKRDGLRKRHKNYDSLICQTVFPPPPPPPPDEHVLYKDSFASGNGEQVDTNKLLIGRPGG